MDAKHKDALRELEIAALRGHPDGYATSDCTVTYKEAADALRAAIARIDELETALAKEDQRACACITELANEVLRYRIAGHMNFNKTRKNPRGSITDEARQAIQARLIEELDKHGYDLSAAPEAHDG